MPRVTLDSVTADYIEDRERLIGLATRIVDSRAIAEEIVQESWIKLHDKSYPAAKTKPVLTRIVSNLALDILRRRRRESDILELHGLTLAQAPDSEQVVAARQNLARAVQALQAMPKRKVRALRLRSFDGFSYAEIARVMGVSRTRAYELVVEALVELTVSIGEI